MARLIIGLIVGLFLGGALVFFLLIGVPRATVAPGKPVLAPDPSGSPSGTAQIVLGQAFFHSVLDTMFRDMKPPTFPLAGEELLRDSGDCSGAITILSEGSGVSTGLHLENNSLSAPIAFSGSYNSPVGCLRFTGWAEAALELRFDAAKQTVFGQINVQTINLDGVNPLLTGIVTPLVQTALNDRVNPITIVDGRQIALNIPIKATQGDLQAAVKDVRAEVKDNSLYLYVVYDFKGQPAQ